MSKTVFDEINQSTNTKLSLEPSSRVIRVADGGIVSNISQCTLPVSFDDCYFPKLTVYVVSQEFPSLLVRDLIRTIWGDSWLNKLIVKQVDMSRSVEFGSISPPRSGSVHFCTPDSVRSSTGKCNTSDHSSPRVQEFVSQIRQHPVFAEGLGDVTKYMAELQVKDGAEMRKFKARAVPIYIVLVRSWVKRYSIWCKKVS